MTDRFCILFQSARRIGTPIVGIQTPDPAATIGKLTGTAISPSVPIVIWDVCRGWTAGNEPGRVAMATALDGAPPDAPANPVANLMEFAPKLPPKTVLFAINAHRYLTDGTASGAAFVQAVWNLRDVFKGDLRTLVLMGPGMTLPAEVGGDVLMLDEPLPTDTELGQIVCDVLEAASVACTEDVKDPAVDALRGLPSFSAEQAVYMALGDKGLDLDLLWDRKRKMISATPGLSVWKGGETLDDVGGNEQVKTYVRLLLQGRDAPRVIVFIDEIEKMLAGATSGAGDSSGVSQGQLQQLLVYMQDAGASGMIFVGPPGAGKSAIAKAIGAAADVPTVALDLGGMKASLVGESEARLRQALKVIDAVGGGRALFVATCNKIATLPPELRRRFTMGTFFFDLPDAGERDAIWNLYYRKFALDRKTNPPPEDGGWTGAEIRQACLLAYRLGIPLRQAPQFIVPVSISAREDIEGLQRQADRKFLSASRPGVYEMRPREEINQPRRARAIAGSEV